MQFIGPEHDPNSRLIRYPNPMDESGWPAAESSKIFILGAVAAAGAALHGEDWTGKELAAVQWRESPKAALARIRLPRNPPPRSIAIERTPRPPKTEAELKAEDATAEKRQVLWAENALAETRLMQAVNWLAQRCRDGDLKPFARPAGGGEVMPMLASEWNIDDPFEQFVMKGGSLRRFIIGGHASPVMESFVFFDRTELREVLAREPHAPLRVGEADLSRLSPYLRLAVHVALKRKYFEGEKIDKAAARSAEIEDAWKEFLPDVPMTPATVASLTKLIGFPDPEAIERGRRGGNAAKRGSTTKA